MAGSKTKKKTGEQAKTRAAKASKKPATKKTPAAKATTKKPSAKASTKAATKKPSAKVSSKPATKKTPAEKKPSATKEKKAMPAALVKRAEAEVAAKRARLAKDGRADIDLILRRRERIAEDFWDIGEALVRLKRPGIAEALGRASFREICEKDLSMSLSAAESLIQIVSGVAREDALRMGQDRALALVTLAKATPELDSATTLQKGTRKLPSGKVIDFEKATTRELYAAAKELRGAGAASARPRGRTTTSEERERAAGLQDGLVASGLSRARVSAVATKPGQEADIKIEGVPISALAKLRAALPKSA